jgi:FkbH-like protein
LTVSETPIRRVLLVGSCLMHFWEQALLQLAPACPSDLYMTGGPLPEHPARPIGEYDCQIVHLPLRSVLPDGAFAQLGQDDTAGHETLFAFALNMTRNLLRAAMRWNLAHGLLTFVFPFVVPQQNPAGRLLPRYDLRNLVFFIEQLNQALAGELSAYGNAYFFDLNEIVATHGRRFVHEDTIALGNHGAFLTDYDFDLDGGRLDPPHRATEVYESRLWPIITAAFQEMGAMLRTIRQADMVKLVVVDLDDTLWRGTIAELSLDELPTAEGWPRGFWEALLFLKRRGVLLAIISQNDEARVLEAWPRILGRQLSVADFVIRRIDWRPKAQKMTEVLEAVNLLAANVVYIDDNPVQRSEIAAAFPAMRVLGGDPFTWRHILLWSAETQTAEISAESTMRTQMVQAQVARETQRAVQPRGEFLDSLNVRMKLFQVNDVSHPRFGRALELINKTNQFNTTGQRWTRAECEKAFADGKSMHAFELSDVYTEYGLVGVLIVGPVGIRQFVMSCRVMGLEAEIAAVCHIVALFKTSGLKTIVARMIKTDRNLPCRNIYERCGFTSSGGVWTRATAESPPGPAHITLTTGSA